MLHGAAEAIAGHEIALGIHNGMPHAMDNVAAFIGPGADVAQGPLNFLLGLPIIGPAVGGVLGTLNHFLGGEVQVVQSVELRLL